MELQMVSAEVSIPCCFGALENLPWMNTIQHHTTTICQVLETSMNQTTCSKRIQLVLKNLKIPYHSHWAAAVLKICFPKLGAHPAFSPTSLCGATQLAYTTYVTTQLARNLLITHNLHTQLVTTQLTHTQWHT